MFVCIPVAEDRGLASPVSGHFGSTPMFLIVDTASGSCRAIANANRDHGSGPCNPLVSIAGERIDRVVVGGIGAGALEKLRAAGIPAYASTHATVSEVLAAIDAGTLTPVESTVPCHDHAHGGH